MILCDHSTAGRGSFDIRTCVNILPSTNKIQQSDFLTEIGFSGGVAPINTKYG